MVGSLYSLLSSPPPGTARIVRSWWLSLVRCLQKRSLSAPSDLAHRFPDHTDRSLFGGVIKLSNARSGSLHGRKAFFAKIKTGHQGHQDVRSCGSQCPVTVTGKSIELVPGVGRNEKTLSEYFQIKDLTSSGSVESLTLLATPAPVGSYSTAVSSGT